MRLLFPEDRRKRANDHTVLVAIDTVHSQIIAIPLAGVITDEQRSRQCHADPRKSSTVSTLLLPHSISLAWTPSPNFPNEKSIFQTAPALILVRTAAAKT